MSDPLRRVAFDPASMREWVEDFHFGAAPYEVELRTWLLRDAEREIAEGVRVWLYVDESGEAVGYGSLAKAVWPYPPHEPDQLPLAIIPALGLRVEYHGCPVGSAFDARYAKQMMDHLLDEAARLPDVEQRVGLFVHPDNGRAAAFYRKCGFQRLPLDYLDPVTNATYLFYARSL